MLKLSERYTQHCNITLAPAFVITAHGLQAPFTENCACRCTAVKVVMAHDTVADALIAKVMEKVAKLTVGKPEDNCDVRMPVL